MSQIEITLKLSIIDEKLLRTVARDRMIAAGIEKEEAERTASTDLSEAAYQAILGSNNDIGYLDLGLELKDRATVFVK